MRPRRRSLAWKSQSKSGHVSQVSPEQFTSRILQSPDSTLLLVGYIIFKRVAGRWHGLHLADVPAAANRL
jgi:hypothetical protein